MSVVTEIKNIKKALTWFYLLDMQLVAGQDGSVHVISV